MRRVAALPVAFFLLFSACKHKPAPPGPKAPEFTAPALGGGSCKLSDAKGKVVLLEFWSSRCPYCRKEVAEIKKLSSKIDSSKVAVFVVHTFGGTRVEEAVKRFDFGKGVKVCLDDGTVTKQYICPRKGKEGTGQHLEKPWCIHGVPHMLIIDKKGRFREVHRGLTKASKLLEAIKAYL